MNHFPKAYLVLICLLAAAAIPSFAGTWDPVSTDGMLNTAVGSGALANPNLDSDGGCRNTAAGYDALRVDTSGSYNTAMGLESLAGNLTGNANTGLGAYSLYSNTSGDNNTASGYYALYSNSSGIDNTASGYDSLYHNTTGGSNTASGYEALYSNTTGGANAATGSGALFHNTTGYGSAAQGAYALYGNTTGIRNVGIGNYALNANATGSYNIALGYDAGSNANGSNNIEIGTSGSASDNSTIQIGVQVTQTKTSIAGIYGTPVTGSAVYVTSTGHLGVQASSERYKTDIPTMPDLSSKLVELRPVTFHYRNDPTGTLQYGLIAEEVAKVYPELVIRDDSGMIHGVHYEELALMLLNELQ